MAADKDRPDACREPDGSRQKIALFDPWINRHCASYGAEGSNYRYVYSVSLLELRRAHRMDRQTAADIFVSARPPEFPHRLNQVNHGLTSLSRLLMNAKSTPRQDLTYR